MPKPARKPAPSSSDSDSGPDDKTPVKKAKKDEDGTIFDLGKSRRVTVRSFKGKTYVDIREYYIKDGDMAPGKKGISLSPDQWKLLLDNADDINKAIREA